MNIDIICIHVQTYIVIKIFWKINKLYLIMLGIVLMRIKELCWCLAMFAYIKHEVRVLYNRARNQVRKTTHTLKRQHELKIANENKSNQKAFWSYFRAHHNIKSVVTSTMIRTMQKYCNISCLRVISKDLNHVMKIIWVLWKSLWPFCQQMNPPMTLITHNA